MGGRAVALLDGALRNAAHGHVRLDEGLDRGTTHGAREELRTEVPDLDR